MSTELKRTSNPFNEGLEDKAIKDVLPKDDIVEDEEDFFIKLDKVLQGMKENRHYSPEDNPEVR